MSNKEVKKYPKKQPVEKDKADEWVDTRVRTLESSVSVSSEDVIKNQKNWVDINEHKHF